MRQNLIDLYARYFRKGGYSDMIDLLLSSVKQAVFQLTFRVVKKMGICTGVHNYIYNHGEEGRQWEEGK